MLSIINGILSAATWGAADFIGGIASKRTSPYRVLFLAEISEEWLTDRTYMMLEGAT